MYEFYDYVDLYVAAVYTTSAGCGGTGFYSWYDQFGKWTFLYSGASVPVVLWSKTLSVVDGHFTLSNSLH